MGSRTPLLGTRPRGWFPRFHVLGRETFLTSVEWVGGWSWSPTDRSGRLAPTATGGSLDRPGRTFVGRRRQHPDCRARRPVPPGPVALAVEIARSPSYRPPSPPWVRRHPASGPADPKRSLGDGDPLAELDGRYLSAKVARGFTGRVIGMYVTEGSAAFGWLEYVPASA